LAPTPPSLIPTPFPYTTLFRSLVIGLRRLALPEPQAHVAQLLEGNGQIALGLTVLGIGGGAFLADVQALLIIDLRRWHLAESQRSEEHTSELQSLRHLVCRLLL